MKRIAAWFLALILAGAAAPGGGAIAAGPEAAPSALALKIDGRTVTGAEVYNIDGANYFRLRDIAMLLRDTDARFDVRYDPAANAVLVTTGDVYVPLGTELAAGSDKSATCAPSRQSVIIDGKSADLMAYNMGDTNFFKLRDLGAAIGFGVDYDAATATMLVSTQAARVVRLGTSDCFITLSASYAPREAGGYASSSAGVGFDIYELTGSAKALAASEAGGAPVTETTVNGVPVAEYQSGSGLVFFVDAGGGKVEKLAFYLPDGDAAPAERIIGSLTKMLVIPLGDSPLCVAASPAFQAGAVTDAANGQAAAYADAGQGRSFDLYLHSCDGSFDAFVSDCAASYGGSAGGIVTYTPLVKYFTVSGEWMSALIDLGGKAAELRFRPAGGDMGWALEIVRSLRAG